MVSLQSFGLTMDHIDIAKRSSLTFCRKNDLRGLKRNEAYAEALYALACIAKNHPHLLDLEVEDNLKILRMKLAYTLKAYFSNFALSTVHDWLVAGKHIPRSVQVKEQHELARYNIFLILSDYLLDTTDWQIYYHTIDGKTPAEIGQELKIDRNLVYRRIADIKNRISTRLD